MNNYISKLKIYGNFIKFTLNKIYSVIMILQKLITLRIVNKLKALKITLKYHNNEYDHNKIRLFYLTK
jgi:hypothetical protein